MQFYSNPARETDAHALPDCEVYEVRQSQEALDWADESSTAGWYFQCCLPGCLPDSDPVGPFDSEQEAIDACRAECEQE
jgi:hypothetical protein